MIIDNNKQKRDIIEKIRKEEIDINNQELFISILIKGLLQRLDDDIKIRNKSVPHIILHTGDFTMFKYSLLERFKDNKFDNIASIEDIYNIIPRCMVEPKGINLLSDQLTSPYSMGLLQYEHIDNIYSLIGEFRRMPMKLTCDLKYYIDSYTDALALIQQIITKLSFIRSYNITYMGQHIECSYVIPSDFESEYLTELDGITSDNKSKTIPLSLEIETTFPVWNSKTMIYNDNRISNPLLAIYDNEKNIKLDNPNMNPIKGIRIYPKGDIINKPDNYEIS